MRNAIAPVGVLVLLAVLAAGCATSKRTDEAAGAAPLEAHNPHATSPDSPAAADAAGVGETAAAVGTAADADAAPTLRLVGEDYEQMIRSHYAYRDWLYEHPDPSSIELLMHPDCTCFEDDRVLLEDYRAKGLRWRGGQLEVLEVAVIDDQAEDMVHLRVTIRRTSPGELVDASGRVHDRLHPIGPHAWEELYVREGPDKPWLLRVADEVGPVERSAGEQVMSE